MRCGMRSARGLCPDPGPGCGTAWLASLCPARARCHQAWPRPVVVHVSITPCLLLLFQGGSHFQPPHHPPPPRPQAPHCCRQHHPKSLPLVGPCLWQGGAVRLRYWVGGPSCGNQRHPLLPGQLGAPWSCLLLLHPCKPSPRRSLSSATGCAPSPKQGKRDAQAPPPAPCARQSSGRC